MAVLPSAHSQSAVFTSGFEFAEGYNPDLSLIGQDGWIGFGAGGNGIVTNFFDGFGQQAYIGSYRPTNTTDAFFSVARPVNFDPVATGQPLVKFSVMMQVVDSSSPSGPWDDFRWSVYNTNSTRLFTLDFDNASLLISYGLDNGAGFVPTTNKFDSLGYYDLEIVMNFARNLWSATLNDVVIVNAKPITTIGTPLSLGDIDAVWAVRDPSAPGDNYLLFDNYTISAEPAAAIPARLEPIGIGTGGSYHLRLYGEPALRYRIETSIDLVHWEALLTLTAPAEGVLDIHDSTAATFLHRYYRARQAP